MDNNNSENFMLEDTLEMEQCQHWYRTKLSPNLPREDKENLLARINNYRLKYQPLPYINPLSEFPELQKYTEKDFITGPQILVIAMEPYRELGESRA